MKHLTFFLPLLFVSLVAMAGRNTNYCMGSVHFKDGSVEEYTSIYIPNVGDRSITVTTDEKRKEKMKLLGTDIAYLELWTSKTPDVHNYLYFLDYEYRGKEYHRICLLEAESAWGTAFLHGDFYSFNSKTGRLYGVVVTRNGVPGNVFHFLRLPGDETTILFAINQSWQPRKQLAAELFADNPEVRDAIVSGTLHPSDIQYILDQMTFVASTSDKPAMPKSAPKLAAMARERTAIPNGIDREYERKNAIGVNYEHYFRPHHQSVELTYDWGKSFFRVGMHVGLKTYDSRRSVFDENGLYAGDTTRMVYSLLTGIHFIGQIPIRINKFYLIPRLVVSPTIAPIAFMREGIYLDMPFRVGADFEIPLRGEINGLDLGLYYVYDLMVADQVLGNSLLSGMSGLGVRICYAF